MIGPAVNEVSRITSLCRSLHQRLLMSARFAACVSACEIDGLHSIGRHVLKGVRRPQELFTIASEKRPAGNRMSLQTDPLEGSPPRAGAHRHQSTIGRDSVTSVKTKEREMPLKSQSFMAGEKPVKPSYPAFKL